MKKYSLEKFKEKRKNRQMFKFTLVIIIAVILLILVALYMANRNFRSFVDIYILRKEINESNANSLTIDTEKLSLIYAYDKTLVIYADGNINFYNSSTKKTGSIEMTLSKPIADSEDKYLVLGDHDSQKICLIKSNNLVWQKDIEGKVSKICVNKNGYSAVSISGTTYESIVMLFNPKGELMFTDYLSTDVIGIDISEDNKYLAIAETNNSGISPVNIIEILSIETAMTDSENATVNTYQSETNEFLTEIKYQKKNNLLCCFDKYVLKMTDKECTKIYEISDLTAFIDVDLEGNFARVDKEQSSVFKSDYRLKLGDEKGNEKVYIIEGNLKSIKAKDNIVGLNLGTEIQFINKRGWLEKKYTSTQEIKDFEITDNIGIIIYDDKIDFIEL